MADIGERLRLAMRRVPSSVTVVTAAARGEIRGITVGSFTSVSLDPPLISFNVAREASMHRVIVGANNFAVHLLADTQADLSTVFAEPHRVGEEQFEKIDHTMGEFGVPVLVDVAVVFHCVVWAVHPAGDHSLVIGRVRGVDKGEDTGPLVYFDRSYHHLGDRLPIRVWPI